MKQNCHSKNNKNKGFTLLEMIIVIVVLSIIAVIATDFLRTTLNAYWTQRDVTDAYWQGRFALEQMTRRIEAVRSSNDITTATSTRLTFTDVNGNSNDYQISGSTLTYNSISLADGFNLLNFTYLDSNAAATAVLANIRYVIITLNMLGTNNSVNIPLRTTVYLRNLQ